MLERRRGRDGACGGPYRIDLGGDSNDEKNEIIIHLGLRRPPMDHFTHNNQSKKSQSGIVR